MPLSSTNICKAKYCHIIIRIYTNMSSKLSLFNTVRFSMALSTTQACGMAATRLS